METSQAPTEIASGCELQCRPNARTTTHLRNNSRPGPKSGVEGRIILAHLFLQCQITHSVRVPALSVGAGGGNKQAHALPQQVPKTNGIQVIYGKQDPTHNWNRYVKRSFKRACHRAIVHGQAPYKGRLLTVANPQESGNTPRVINRKAPTHTQPRRLQVYCLNVGGPWLWDVRRPHGISGSVTL